MTRFRMGALTALIACVGAFSLAGTASAAQVAPAKVPASKKVAITGTKGFKGTYTITSFQKQGSKIVTLGTLKGTMRKNGKTKRVRKTGVVMPAAVDGAGPSTAANASQLPNIPNACQVLNLVLGPINLNLLGLVVRTNQINVRIDAVPGAGNLLGNLLCAVTNLLNPDGVLGPLTGAINQLTAALNAILAVLPTNPPAAAAAVAGSR